MLLEARGFPIKLVDDNAAVDVAGVGLVVLSGSCASATLPPSTGTWPSPC